MENFFGIMKSELLYAEKFDSAEAFIKALEEYIDYYIPLTNQVQVKRKESRTIPNSFCDQVIFFKCPTFGEHFRNPALQHSFFVLATNNAT